MIANAARKPPRVLAIRAAQEVRLAIMHGTGRWTRLEREIERWWTARRVDEYVSEKRSRRGLIASDGPVTLRAAAERGLIDAEALIAMARRVKNRDLEVLGARVPREGPWSWHMDWRWNHTWSLAYFRSYRHYETPRPRPYDVKLPWELSRLGFVPSLMQAAALDPQQEWVEDAIAIIDDWARANPLAHSIAWDPMEASMRSVALVSTLEMALALDRRRADIVMLLRLLAAHGEFVWRTLEYTDVRGNHYAANLVALLLLGLTLEGAYPGARKWRRYAARAIPREVGLQLLADGVDFEKSLAYHRLVTELFVLALIVMQRIGLVVPSEMRERLHSACVYSAVCTRPDGLAPNVGDNDSARALTFDPVDPRDHRPLIGLGALLFGDGALKGVASCLPAAAPWLLGRDVLADWEKIPSAVLPEFTHFTDGGVMVVRRGDSYLWFDAGEVGLAGRGGHGHNDMLSFELMLEGRSLVVDPGCPVYSADFEARNLFRSTAYHNTLRVDGQELAPMWGWWGIGNHAVPSSVSATWDGFRVIARATHGGYRRLEDPVWHTREVTFSPREGVLECVDSLRCRRSHHVERYLHLAPEVVVITEGQFVRMACKGRAWSLSWEGAARLTIEEGAVSPGYGVTEPASILVLANTVEGDSKLKFAIAPVSSS